MSKHRAADRSAIQEEVFFSSASPVWRVSRRFGITKQAVQHHIQAMTDQEVLEAEGELRHRRYRLKTLLRKEQSYI